jgi:putative membrane protein
MENRQSNPLVWLGIALVIAVGLMALFAALVGGPWGMGDGMMGVGWGWGMALFMIVPAVFLIVVLLVALGALGERTTSRTPTPLEILEVRYARGEVTQEEYKRVRADLEGRRREEVP